MSWNGHGSSSPAPWLEQRNHRMTHAAFLACATLEAMLRLDECLRPGSAWPGQHGLLQRRVTAWARRA